LLNQFEKLVKSMTLRTAQAAQVAMIFIMVVIVANVILRIPWKPLGGTVELVEMAGSILLALGIAYTAMMKGHIMVGILVEKFPPRIRGFTDFVVNLVALVFSFILARELLLYALNMLSRGYETGHLKIPVAPSIFLVAFGFIMLCMVLLLNLLRAAQSLVKGGEAR
jgi:TRAP-type C4-dicarboxylate transport system permease small subunit